MTPGELGVAAFFIAVALFGIVDAIRTPLVVKRLYRNKGFTDTGKKTLAEISDSRLVGQMYTEHFHYRELAGELAGESAIDAGGNSGSDATSQSRVAQCKAWSTSRRNFTLSKATRKRNRTPWSITVVQGDFSNLSCLVLPTVVPEAIAYVGNGEDIDFGEDVEIANRYHITASNEALVRSAITPEIRAFLLQPDVIFIESTDNELVIKRTWNDHLVLDRLQQELDTAQTLRALLKG